MEPVSLALLISTLLLQLASIGLSFSKTVKSSTCCTDSNIQFRSADSIAKLENLPKSS